MPVEIGELNTRVELRSSSPTKGAPARSGKSSQGRREFSELLDQALKQRLRSLLRELD